MSDVNETVIEQFRKNGGQVDGSSIAGFPERVDIALLTITGARSGRVRTVPVQFFVDGDEVFVIASAAGSDRHPDWYHNLLANPAVGVEIGTESLQAVASPVQDEQQYDRLFQIAIEHQPVFAGYRAGTTRRIPILTLRFNRGRSRGPVPDETTRRRLI